jgi:foldase protein PrsA
VFASIVAVVRRLRSLPALGAFFVVTIVLAACGDAVPGNAVVSVDGETISRAQFAHWVDIAESTGQAQGAPKIDYVPPAFTACVAAKKKTAPKPAKGQPQQTDAQFKTQCKQEYEGLRNQVMEFLILEKWVNGEAADQGLKVSAKEADKEFETAKKQSFPKEKDFQAFLKQSGMTLKDAKFQVRVNTVLTKLRKKATDKAPKVTDKQVVAFYNKNKARFAKPAMRDLRVILTKTKARADEAKAALQAGQGWKAVAKKYSIDQASKNQGGSLLNIAKGTQEKSFDDAIFKAKKGELTGPVKTQFGFYVFQVQKIVPATQESLQDAKKAIRPQLVAQAQQKAGDEFNKDLRKKWKARTNCAKGYEMVQCKNAPKPKTNTLPPGGPQTVPTQG